jgi:thiol-disulfide isomerase/thioredoxin
MHFLLNDTVTADFEVLIVHGDEDQGMLIENGGEEIYLNSIKGQEFPGFLFPYFESKIEWKREDKGDMSWKGWLNKQGAKPVSFIAERMVNTTVLNEFNQAEKMDLKQGIQLQQHVIFEQGTENEYHAKGLFDLGVERNTCRGTFLTETGDYRFLKGELKNGKLQLQCLDGAHLFCFTAQYDSVNLSFSQGVFYSGNTYSEKWESHEDREFKLRDPDQLVHLKKEYEGQPFQFKVTDLQGNPREFGIKDWEGKFSIIQLMGSWCPNCTDESKMMASFHKKYESKGLQIIPVAFERIDDINVNRKVIQKQMAQLNCGYDAFVGLEEGRGKERAKRVFYQLDNVIAFPTTIGVDSTGRVVFIHTGFNGPATGPSYTQECLFFEKWIEKGLNNK